MKYKTERNQIKTDLIGSGIVENRPAKDSAIIMPRSEYRWLQLLLLFVVFATSTVVNAQIIKGTVVDENADVLIGAYVQDTVFRAQTSTDDYGNFYIRAREGSVLKVTYLGYKTAFKTIDAFTDTINVFFQLEPENIKLGEVVISSNRVKPVVRKQNVNVLDYLPFEGFTLTLKKEQSKKVISIEGLDTTYRAFDVPNDKVNALFEDCYGNIHLLSEDSSYQIWANSSLNVISRSPIETFEEFLKPCIGNFESNNVFYSFSRHKQKYNLASFSAETRKKERFFSVWDKEAEKVANQEYWKIIALYHGTENPDRNLILNNVWSGDLIALQLPGAHELNLTIGWYLKVRAKEIKVQTFQLGDELLTIDYLNDTIHRFNAAGQQIHQVKFQAPAEKISELLIDKMNYKCYALTINKGRQSLYLIDPDSGETEQVFTLKETGFAENIQVFDDTVYFLKAKTGFSKLYQIALGS